MLEYNVWSECHDLDEWFGDPADAEAAYHIHRLSGQWTEVRLTAYALDANGDVDTSRWLRLHPGVPDVTAAQLATVVGHWNEFPAHPRATWKARVADDSTRVGYWDWVANQLEGAWLLPS
jgi:hypothetical protein